MTERDISFVPSFFGSVSASVCPSIRLSTHPIIPFSFIYSIQSSMCPALCRPSTYLTPVNVSIPHFSQQKNPSPFPSTLVSLSPSLFPTVTIDSSVCSSKLAPYPSPGPRHIPFPPFPTFSPSSIPISPSPHSPLPPRTNPQSSAISHPHSPLIH